MTICRFNPRPHTAGDQILFCRLVSVRRFNPRPHTAGDPERAILEGEFGTFQSTPAHGGRHLVVYLKR
mgnify:CR=1 FL=1